MFKKVLTSMLAVSSLFLLNTTAQAGFIKYDFSNFSSGTNLGQTWQVDHLLTVSAASPDICVDFQNGPQVRANGSGRGLGVNCFNPRAQINENESLIFELAATASLKLYEIVLSSARGEFISLTVDNNTPDIIFANRNRLDFSLTQISGHIFEFTTIDPADAFRVRSITFVSEPAALGLIGLGLGLIFFRRQRRK